ncbi:hypothetical protein [Xanthomonas maliensis]|uniref:hypothetical protein n=1 Tax=Xanthomonas maliensis TaxID=1321368 RepID=UPI00039DF42C|nr:hypothetical protein [Xanthomonas maliensis]KAB7770730.1 hypothetical protein CKY51_04195 [Xanthomonas maliensis]
MDARTPIYRPPPLAFLHCDYRQRYAPVLAQHPDRPIAIAELCLFRCWLASSAYWQLHGTRDGAAGPVTWPLPPGWALPRQADGQPIEPLLGGGWLDMSAASRFDLYSAFFLLGRHSDDPQGLQAVSLALGCQLFVQPPGRLQDWLTAETRSGFSQLLRLLA